MSEAQPEADFIELEKMSIDQMAGAFVLIMGAIGSLLLVYQINVICLIVFVKHPQQKN